MRKGIAIPLRYQHDHIEDSILVYSSHACSVYLLSNRKADGPSFVKLVFEGAMCVRSARTDCSPSMGIYPKEHGSSFIVELTDSTWPVEAHAAYVYAGSSIKPRGKHFVVSNHDVFHEILADSFAEHLVIQGDAEYESIKRYFSE